jgi:hypothetical protein
MIQNFWYKKFIAIRNTLLQCLNTCLKEPQTVPDFLMNDLTYMIPKKGVLDQEEINKRMSLLWLTDGYPFPETEGFLMAIQDEVIGTQNYRKYIVKDTTKPAK